MSIRVRERDRFPEDPPYIASAMPFGEADLLTRLRELGIHPQIQRHPPVHTVEEAKAVRGPLDAGHTKNLFLKDKAGALFLVTALESTRVDLKELARELGAKRFSFANAALLMAHLGVSPGAVTPFALLNDAEARVGFVLDAALLAGPHIHAHPLHNAATLAVTPAELLKFAESCGRPPRIVEFAQGG